MSVFFRVNAGSRTALVYLLIFLFGVVQLIFGANDALFGLGILLLTLPWSIILLDWANKYLWLTESNSAAIYYAIIALCILLNMLLLHCIWYLFSMLWRAIFRKK